MKDSDVYKRQVYEKAAENFQMFQDKGWLVQDEKENYYVYAQTMKMCIRDRYRSVQCQPQLFQLVVR